MPELVPHILTVGETKYAIKAPDKYENIKEETGMAKAPENDKTVFDGGRVSISGAASQGLIFRLDYTLKGGKNGYIYVAGDKVRSAPGGIQGKNINGVSVTSARYRRQAVFR